MKRCLCACHGCYWFGNFEEDGDDGLNYNCIGTDDTWFSKKDYEEQEVPDDCPHQDLHETMQEEETIE
jgi:hypothetical protein